MPFLGLLLASVLAPHAALATRVSVPGTLVTLEPPPGWAPMSGFPGFEYPAKTSTIMVSESAGSVKDARQAMSKEALAGRGMTLISSQSVKATGGTATLLLVAQRRAGKEFRKWMLLAGDASRSILVVGAYPKISDEMSLPIKRAVLSASWSASGTAATFEGLTFRVDPAPRLKLAGRAGTVLIFSESGKMQPADSTEAMLIVGASYLTSPIQNVEQFARARASQTLRVGPLRQVQGRAVTQDGLPGYELVASTNDTQSGRELKLYQFLVVDRTTYYLAQGFATPQHAPAVLAQFRLVTGSFHRARAPGRAR